MYSVIITRHSDGAEHTAGSNLTLPEAYHMYKQLDHDFHWHRVTIVIRTAAPRNHIREYKTGYQRARYHITRS